jgi:hypothetical protein
MTMLSIVQTIAEEVGVSAPSSVAGSQDRTAKQLLRIVNRAGSRLARKPWPILQTEYTFATVAGTPDYALPADFSELLSDTVWDRVNYWQLRGGLTPQEWQVRKSAITVSVSTRKRFRIKALAGVKKFYIDPTPGEVVTLVFEYLSTAWARETGSGALKTAFTADTDVSLFQEELLEMSGIWRFRAAKGLDYAEARKEYDEQLEAIFGAESGAGAINMGRALSNDAAWRMNIRESGFG